MSLELATGLVRIFYAYVGVGVLLLPWWHWAGLRRLDTGAAAGPWGFRVLISFGLVALWLPLVFRAHRGSGHPPAERNAHRDRARTESQQ